ncbi:hypothetical protein [Planctomicrobium sp. SH527]|uniref:hypothetical protein n=1 Tax=Planctomicrobium sp. SH527 TaxID=3448123 RepID=UPI003F5B7110
MSARLPAVTLADNPDPLADNTMLAVSGLTNDIVGTVQVEVANWYEGPMSPLMNYSNRAVDVIGDAFVDLAFKFDGYGTYHVIAHSQDCLAGDEEEGLVSAP